MEVTYDAREALKVSVANRSRSWWAAKGGRSAAARLTGCDPVRIDHRPKFPLTRDLPVFTIGSCFARNIESMLVRRGYPLLLKGHGIDAELYDSWDEETQRGGGVEAGRKSRSAFNKYSVHSISHEMKRVILDKSYPQEGLIALDDGLWFDPQASGLKATDLETALASRRAIDAAMREIKRAKVVFITLGLTETWLDRETGLALNRHPGTRWLKRFGDRFAFVDYGFDAMLEEMTGLIDLVRETCHSDMRFVVTVSPVPLGTTFKPADVIVANTASKSTLRAVAEELARHYDFVDYFPSYEMVVNSPRAMAWQADQLHVTLAMIDAVITAFLADYYGDVVEADPVQETVVAAE